MRLKKPIPLTCLILIAVFCRAQSPEIERIQHTLPHIHDSLAYVDAMNRLAMLLYEKNIDSTFHYTKQARDIADRLQYSRGKADALNNLGVVYDLKGNIQLALRYYNEAFNSYTVLKDSSNIVQTLMNIAGVYHEAGKDGKARLHYKKAMALGNQLKYDSIMSLVIYNYLLTYPADFPNDSTTWYLNKAQTIARKYSDDRTLLAIDQITADNAIMNDHRTEGISLLHQIIDKALSGHLYFLSLDLLIDAGDQLAQSDSAMAAGYYKKGLNLSYNNGYLIYSQVLARKLCDFYTARKDSAAAFHYSLQLIRLAEELEKLNGSSGIDYIDYALKDQQLTSIRERSEYQSMLLLLTGVICTMTILIIITLWRSWKKTQRTASALRLQFQQSESTTAALDTMNKNYAKLLKVVAHDLRNPIGTISTISSMLAKKELDDQDHSLFQMIQTSAQTSLTLINELLATDFDQQQQLDKQDVSIDQLLQQCVGLLSFRAKDKGQSLKLETDKDLIMHLDKEKINRVINNLIVNAIKFSPKNSEILVMGRRVPNGVIISVKDTGIGIPPDMQIKIFDPFTTAKRKGTGGEQPFGLGLYISKQIVEAHHGKISFTSEPGRGTDFQVRLPF